LFPVRISTSKMFINTPRHNNRVLLHRPNLGSRFRSNINGAPFLILKYVRANYPEQWKLRILADISCECHIQPH
jgi:hypothetical protein